MIVEWRSIFILKYPKIKLFVISWGNPMRHGIYGWATTRPLYLPLGQYIVGQVPATTFLFGEWLGRTWIMEIWIIAR
jgi:hypothetical protein